MVSKEANIATDKEIDCFKINIIATTEMNDLQFHKKENIDNQLRLESNAYVLPDSLQGVISSPKRTLPKIHIHHSSTLNEYDFRSVTVKTSSGDEQEQLIVRQVPHRSQNVISSFFRKIFSQIYDRFLTSKEFIIRIDPNSSGYISLDAFQEILTLDKYSYSHQELEWVFELLKENDNLIPVKILYINLKKEEESRDSDNSSNVSSPRTNTPGSNIFTSFGNAVSSISVTREEIE